MTPEASISPIIIERVEQPYVAFRRTVTMPTVGQIADRLPELMGWLAQRRIQPAGAPFLKYDLFTRTGRMVVEACAPVSSTAAAQLASPAPAPEGPAAAPTAGLLPGGRFASLTHVGHPRGLLDATAELLDWGFEGGLTWDTSSDDSGEHWGLRMELYKTDPRIEPDLDRWETDIVFRLADPHD